MLKRTFPSPEALRRSPFTLADVAVILGTLLLLGATAWVGRGAFEEFYPT
jgi:NitT/TauT family transport system permease protein